MVCVCACVCVCERFQTAYLKFSEDKNAPEIPREREREREGREIARDERTREERERLVGSCAAVFSPAPTTHNSHRR